MTPRKFFLVASLLVAAACFANGQGVEERAPGAVPIAGAAPQAGVEAPAQAAPALEAPPREGASKLLWIVFILVVGVVILADLFVINRHAHTMKVKEAMAWVTVWTTLALLFNVGVFFWMGSQRAAEFLAGYLVEINLSVDNLFVFLMIFTYFNVKPEHQPRVLSWGVFGAIIMRMVFIFIGMALVRRFDWLLYIAGFFLIYTGVKLLRHQSKIDPGSNWAVRLAKRFLPMTHEFHGEHFFVRESKPGVDGAPGKSRWVATPLLLVLIVIEMTDVVFAVDSVPAVFGVTKDTFIAFTSNVFAILGLRSMYFVLTAFLDKFHLLKYGLSLVLIFIGTKMLIEHKLHISPLIALLVVISILGLSVVASLAFPLKRRPLEPDPAEKDAAHEE